MPISKFSTLTEMKDYVRKNKLNKGEIRLNMKKSVMLAALDKGGHIHTGPRNSDAPKKTTPSDKSVYLASVNNILKIADENMKKKIKDGVKKRGPARFALVAYNVERNGIITNIRIFNSNDYSKFWRIKNKTSSIKKFDAEQLENSSYDGNKPIKITGFIMGKNYKHLKSWSIDKGIPHMIDERPSWWGSTSKLSDDKN